jgi:probable HAF family extracellular repeat protein
MGFVSGRLITSTLLAVALVSACKEAPTGPVNAPDAAKAATGPTVTATDPSSAPRDTTLDVRVLGSGFDRGSKSEFAPHGGVVSDANVRTNRTSYKSPKELVANITIGAEAVEALYDVIVTTSSGKKGIGSEQFAVLAIELLGADAFGLDVNSTGTVVGYKAVPTTCGGASNGPHVWTETGGLRPLPVPAGTCNASARAINDAGVIVGSVNNAAYRWLPGPSETWTFESLGLADASPQDINSRGDIALLHSNDNINNLIWIGTLWIEGTGEGTGIVHLRDLPGSTRGCLSKGINNLQQVVGRCHYTENDKLVPVVWSSPQSEPTALPQLPNAVRYDPNAINDNGIIVGTARTTSGVYLAVRWVLLGGNWTVEDLGSLGGDSEAKSINNTGQIVGLSRVGGFNYHAFVWEAGSGMRDLGALGTQGGQAWGINNPAAGAPTLAAGWSYLSATPQMVLWRIE